MKAIYASKLYKTSTRKDKINAALASSVNTKLLTQLASYLDEEYQTPEYLMRPEDREAQAEQSGVPSDLDAGLGDDFSPSDNLVHLPSGGGSGANFNEDDLFSDSEGESLDDMPSESSEGESDTDISDMPADTGDAPIEESTSIQACTQIDSTIIKGTLNSRNDTKGVNRITRKEDELWIYYNDDTNLNNVMTQVIEYLNASGMTNLEFNRLARSDNAMVFQINETAEEIQPLGSKESKEETNE